MYSRMLTAEEAEEIEEGIRSELKYSEPRSAACILALKIVQKHRGFVSDFAIQAIAEHLSMTPAEVDAVATFYNLIFRKPVGKHVLFLCDSVSCWLQGCDRIAQHLAQHPDPRFRVRLGKTSSDGFLTALPIACLGACDEAPVALLDGEHAMRLDPERLDAILAELQRGYEKKGSAA